MKSDLKNEPEECVECLQHKIDEVRTDLSRKEKNKKLVNRISAMFASIISTLIGIGIGTLSFWGAIVYTRDLPTSLIVCAWISIFVFYALMCVFNGKEE